MCRFEVMFVEEPACFSAQQTAFVKELAKKYIWWKSPEEAARFPWMVIWQAMDIAVFDDVLRLLSIIGEEMLKEAIRRAETGSMREKSWHYWHYILKLAASESEIPPMPRRMS